MNEEEWKQDGTTRSDVGKKRERGGNLHLQAIFQVLYRRFLWSCDREKTQKPICPAGFFALTLLKQPSTKTHPLLLLTTPEQRAAPV